MIVYRIQDNDGRGPYKPGTSRLWADERGEYLPPFFEEFGWEVLSKVPPGMHMGCACDSVESLHRWFSEAERQRLRLMGYREVQLKADGVAAQSERQIVFWSRKPLKFAREIAPCR